jgi:hypothetical protein
MSLGELWIDASDAPARIASLNVSKETAEHPKFFWGEWLDEAGGTAEHRQSGIAGAVHRRADGIFASGAGDG